MPDIAKLTAQIRSRIDTCDSQSERLRLQDMLAKLEAAHPESAQIAAQSQTNQSSSACNDTPFACWRIVKYMRNHDGWPVEHREDEAEQAAKFVERAASMGLTADELESQIVKQQIKDECSAEFFAKHYPEG